MKNKYNLGIIGFGAMALSHYKRLIQGKTKVVVKGVFDINPN